MHPVGSVVAPVNAQGDGLPDMRAVVLESDRDGLLVWFYGQDFDYTWGSTVRVVKPGRVRRYGSLADLPRTVLEGIAATLADQYPYVAGRAIGSIL